MAIQTKVGLEAEYLLYDSKGKLVIPPSSWDRDGFPLLGEIRGVEGKNVQETVINFKSKEMEIIERIRKGHYIEMKARERVPLAIYKKANREANSDDKDNEIEAIKNIYGIEIGEFSDQIIAKGRIQGIHVSCGLHVHFSCAETLIHTFEQPVYEQVIIPLGLDSGLVARRTHDGSNGESRIDFSNSQLVAKEMMSASMYLYRHAGYDKKGKTELHASRLNKPAIHYIVSEMDKAFFDRFAPEAKERTKYRQPGFFELKPYGFEYRSLPATAETMAALPEITRKAFDLIREVNEY